MYFTLTGIPCFIGLPFIVLCTVIAFLVVGFVSFQSEGLWQPSGKQYLVAFFPTVRSLHVSVSHFGTSHMAFSFQ